MAPAAAVDPRTPCLVGVGQATWRPDGSGQPLDVDGLAPEPLAMWESVARAAIGDTGAPDTVLGAVDSLQVVYCQSWPYDDPVARLAERLEVDPGHRRYSGIGGTTPQVLVGDTARAMLAGELDVAVICGAEALASKRRLKKAGERPAWSHRHPEPPAFPFEAPFHDAEVAHEVFQAWLTFPLWDVARRHRLGIDPEGYRLMLGELMAPMTEMAAANRHAWFPVERTGDELVEPTAENRMVGYPYTKHMVSVMDVDMAAALVLCTHGAADALGIDRHRRVYLRGWAHGADPVYVAEHEPLWASPAMAATSRAALAAAGTGIDGLAHLDLYSCFGSSITFAIDALGLAGDDGRPLTVTGGLPFAGGAGSNYLTHALATMVDVLRADPGAMGLVSGVGMHMTKHSYGLYSTTPPPGGLVEPPDEAALQQSLDRGPRAEIVDRHEGSATVATYTVAHQRDGSPEWGLAVCDLGEGRRCYAKVLDADLLEEMESDDWVGAEVALVRADGPMGTMNVVAP